MKVGGLFSGIGGFELGLTRAGMEIAWMVEINDFCQRVLKKHWPTVPIYGDIKNVTKKELGPVELICGGFPCQPFSQAGKQRGKEDDRYLWPEMFRIIRELKPHWIIGENVAGFINMELENAFTDLESEGYKVEAFVLPACSVGLEHRRDRIWIVAYSDSCFSSFGILDRFSQEQRNGQFQKEIRQTNGYKSQMGTQTNKGIRGIETIGREGWEGDFSEPRLVRVSDGLSPQLDRIRGLGNAVVPQIPEILGRCIIEIESNLKTT